MCTPTRLIKHTDAEVLQLAHNCLAELQRRYRPGPAHLNLLAAIRAVQDNLAQVELFHARVAAGEGENKVHRAIRTLDEEAGIPTFLRKAGPS